MRRIVLLVVLMEPLVPSAHAGKVLFDPPYIGVGSGFQSEYEVEVTVVADAGSFDSLNILFGSESGSGFWAPALQFLGFEYTQEFVESAAPFLGAPIQLGVFEEDLFVGGFLLEPLETPFLLGTLKFALPNVAGFYIGVNHEPGYFVNSSRDDGFSSIGLGAQIEPLISAPIPEPAAVLLLFTGAFALSWRSHKAVGDAR